MGWFKKANDASTEEMPALAEVWQAIGPQYGAVVEVRGPESVRVMGTVRGRNLAVDIESEKHRLEELHRLGDGRRAKQVYRTWTSLLAVRCSNPRGLVGTVTAFKDIHDPSWNPRNFDPTHCRKLVSEPASLASQVISPEMGRTLIEMFDDVTICIGTDSVRIEGEDKANVDLGYFGGCLFHRHPAGGAMADRFLVGPPWWIGLLCDIADQVDS